MITLYEFAPVWGIPNLSPARVKVETYLRMVRLPYEVRSAVPSRRNLAAMWCRRVTRTSVMSSCNLVVVHRAALSREGAAESYRRARARPQRRAWQSLAQ
jgi:hypothetical protein